MIRAIGPSADDPDVLEPHAQPFYYRRAASAEELVTHPDDDIRAITAWLTANVGGDVLRISRQPRWRPVWFADVERDGEVLELVHPR